MSNLGETPNSTNRDAVHVAIIPMEAAELLRPGQRVGIVNGKAGPSEVTLGIVDPYLTDIVSKGEKFWLCLLPNTVTGMKHHWEHPRFAENLIQAQETSKENSEKWLRDYASRMNSHEDKEQAFETLIRGLKEQSLFAHGTDLHGFYELDDSEYLKKHAEIYLGISINWEEFEFSCSC